MFNDNFQMKTVRFVIWESENQNTHKRRGVKVESRYENLIYYMKMHYTVFFMC